ncbi:hypothetical protein ANN_26554 [Periplaneta americana]|uniref:Uncharacterized protein n=1 Tax=Periplaneta americana TaxID=6978 RepID=A0ABQ8RYP4_PERAM|nr:hypothetical protein ANN_26554 [Periplaneta americana]
MSKKRPALLTSVQIIEEMDREVANDDSDNMVPEDSLPPSPERGTDIDKETLDVTEDEDFSARDRFPSMPPFLAASGVQYTCTAFRNPVSARHLCVWNNTFCVLPRDLVAASKELKQGELTFRCKQNVLLLSFPDKRVINMISTIHTAETPTEPLVHSLPGLRIFCRFRRFFSSALLVLLHCLLGADRGDNE